MGLAQSEPGLFEILVAFVKDELGIVIPASRRQFILRRLSAGTTMSSAVEVHNFIHSASKTERENFASIFCTHETSFFREVAQMDFFEELCPAILREGRAGKRPKRVRAWSAACSTGQEAYSLGMVLLEWFGPWQDWKTEVWGTDISEKVLRQAATGQWSGTQEGEIGAGRLRKHMMRGVGDSSGLMRANQRLQSIVKFSRLNLAHPPYPVEGLFDVIFCRNVLIYFDASLQAQIVDVLSSHLRSGGHLFVGHNEALRSCGEDLTQVAPSVYRKR